MPGSPIPQRGRDAAVRVLLVKNSLGNVDPAMAGFSYDRELHQKQLQGSLGFRGLLC